MSAEDISNFTFVGSIYITYRVCVGVEGTGADAVGWCFVKKVRIFFPRAGKKRYATKRGKKKLRGKCPREGTLI